MNFTIKNIVMGLLFSTITATSLYAEPRNSEEKPISLRTMGSLFFGGTVATLSNGETFHGDHGYAQYFIPEKSRNYPLILWHGIGQSGRSYESTPDDREGFILPPLKSVLN